MVGIVFSGVEKFYCAIKANNSFLIGVLRGSDNFMSLFLPPFWKRINVFMFSPVLVVILISIIIVLLYLYKTCEVINKKRLGLTIALVILIFVTINALIALKNRPPELKFRIHLFPVKNDSTLTSSAWTGEALWMMIARHMQQATLDQAIVSAVDWNYTIARLDSIKNQLYLTKLNNKLQIEYILYGELSGKNPTPKLTYQMIRAIDGKPVITGSMALNPPELPEISFKISSEILSYFHIAPKAVSQHVKYITPPAYQQYLKGEDYFRQKNYPLALDFAQQAIKVDNGLVEAWLLAGKCCFMTGLEEKKNGGSPFEQLEQAYHWFSHAVRLDSSRDDAYAFLGEYYIYRERWSLAEQMLTNAYYLNPHNLRLYLSLSRLHESRYQKFGFQNEEELFKHAIFINPCYEDAYLMLADHYLFKNKRKQAIKVLEKILEITPHSVPVLMAVGKIYLVRNETLKIIEVFDRILKLEPDNSDAYYNLGILYYNSEDFSIAEKFFLRAIAINNHLNAHLYLAYLCEQKGEFDRAIEHLRHRIHYRKGLDDEFAEEARKHLSQLIHPDSTELKAGNTN